MLNRISQQKTCLRQERLFFFPWLTGTSPNKKLFIVILLIFLPSSLFFSGRADPRGAASGPPQVGQRPDDQRAVSISESLERLSMPSSADSRGSAGRGIVRASDAGAPFEMQDSRRRVTRPAGIASKHAEPREGVSRSIELLANFFRVRKGKNMKKINSDILSKLKF